MKVTKCISLILFVFSILTIPAYGLASSVIQIHIKTILASQTAGGIDPGLRNLVEDLQSVFKYSSYQLLRQDNLNLHLNESGSVSLPGDRMMNITPRDITGGRATIELEISTGNRQIFQTVIRLLNNSSITVGGPKHQDGYLLFNIFNSF